MFLVGGDWFLLFSHLSVRRAVPHAEVWWGRCGGEVWWGPAPHHTSSCFLFGQGASARPWCLGNVASSFSSQSASIRCLPPVRRNPLLSIRGITKVAPNRTQLERASERALESSYNSGAGAVRGSPPNPGLGGLPRRRGLPCAAGGVRKLPLFTYLFQG